MRHLILFLSILIPLAFVFSPFLHDGFFPTMDDVQVVRIEEMYKELISGQFPVRIASDLGNGAGYMLFQFYSPLVYYIGAIFHLLGFSLVISTKLTFLSGFIIAGVGITLLLREYFDDISTFFGAILFFASSYLGYDAYHRGALAEFYALALLPLVFFLIIKFAKTSSLFYLITSSLGIATLVITHNLTTLITFPFIAIAILFLFRKNFFKELNILFLGILLSAFYWLPVISESKYIIVDQVEFVINSYKTNFLTIPQLIGFQKAPWGFIAPMLGIPIFLGAAFSALLMLLNRKFKFLNSKLEIFPVFCLISFFISLFMASSSSQILWGPISPILRFIQFPWRFLTLATFFGAVSCGLFLSQIRPLPVKIFLGIFLILPLFTVQYVYLHPKEYNYISKYTADDPCGTAGWSNEYLTIWTKKCILRGDELQPVNIISGNTNITNLNIKDHGRTYTLDSSGQGTIFFDKYYFPGWNATIDNQSTPIFPSSPNGLISLHVPQGEHKIKLSFENTQARTLGNILSITGVLLVITAAFTDNKIKILSS